MIFNYVTTNKVNGKRYVGSHEGDFIDGYLGSGRLMIKAIKKYGKESFHRDVLNMVTTRKEAFHNEKFLIEMYKTLAPTGYNISKDGGIGVPGREGYWKGKYHSEETKRKIGKAGMGRIVSEKSRKKMSDTIKGENHPMYGKRGEDVPTFGTHRSEETKQKMREARTGKKHSLETKQKMSDDRSGKGNAMYGKRHSNETKKKISESCTRLIKKTK